MKNDLNYSGSDCFETFPFPRESTRAKTSDLEVIGRELYEVRTKVMVDRAQGLTTTYNQLKDPDIIDPEIGALRALHIEMDRGVLAAYGWQDIKVPPYTNPVTDAEWKAKEAFEDEVIDRLFALNAERAAEERALGMGSGGGSKGGAKKPKAQRETKTADAQLSLPSPKKKTRV
jgi:hypothetical protein